MIANIKFSAAFSIFAIIMFYFLMHQSPHE
jgi:hypothetical protein